ncbi:hypothetical protein L202_02103 [Cryptococcus amylolentus CBS 6039]|uniref:Uncharacterized protein n=2 Tax=Cryptococcus amylolentus TaxID=104669 RepID=A0A1E3HZH1_9TREE|nr:hypothetical protein L202_02103 [Cryptococcus amylolentus CBS 6039]ODN81709.1 hypothetical protein L202_02103 [Cryptococcus amylolentus CBS 6039]ODO10089.1 hypothetical protein I350_02316 [Cryptococcus amylolentus CBS 6273]
MALPAQQQHSLQINTSQPRPLTTMTQQRNLVRNSTDTRGEDDVSFFSFSDDTGPSIWCCFGRSQATAKSSSRLATPVRPQPLVNPFVAASEKARPAPSA